MISNEFRQQIKGRKVSTNQPVTGAGQCSWIAVSEQAATRCPIGVHFCCFQPETQFHHQQ